MQASAVDAHVVLDPKRRLLWLAQDKILGLEASVGPIAQGRERAAKLIGHLEHRLVEGVIPRGRRCTRLSGLLQLNCARHVLRRC